MLYFEKGTDGVFRMNMEKFDSFKELVNKTIKESIVILNVYDNNDVNIDTLITENTDSFTEVENFLIEHKIKTIRKISDKIYEGKSGLFTVSITLY